MKLRNPHIFRRFGSTLLLLAPIAVMAQTMAIVDGETYSNDVKTDVETFTYTRSFSNTDWQPLLLPVSLDYADWNLNFEIAKLLSVNTFDKDEDGVPDLTEISFIRLTTGSTTEANMPYLIRAKSVGQSQVLSKANCSVMPAEPIALECSTARQTFLFVGTYQGMEGSEMVAQDGYFLSGGSWYHADSETQSIKPLRFYLQITEKEGGYNTSLDKLEAAPIRLVVEDDAPNVIQTIGQEDRSVRHLNRQSIGLPAGQYLIGGQRIIIDNN